jgi:MoaA/NifB/PqqE/SkfB family radical SAM enzyme
MTSTRSIPINPVSPPIKAVQPAQDVLNLPKADFHYLTVVTTEVCNLDCWMCDFAVSKKLTKTLPMSPQELLAFIRHPAFASLQVLTLTGGEPFAYPHIDTLCGLIRQEMPQVRINFSTNCTLLDRMQKVLDGIDDLRQIRFLVSIDGINKHDEQRGTKGTLQKTLNNLDVLRRRYEGLPVVIKYTITPMNHDDILPTWISLTDMGLDVTYKLIEHNKFYNNKLDEAVPDSFRFTTEQSTIAARQLQAVLDHSAIERSTRKGEIREALESLSSTDWVRPDKCITPQWSAFLDCDLNVFTCKEYAPIGNLKSSAFSEILQSEGYAHVCRVENENLEKCTSCTSQMKIRIPKWYALLRSFAA